MAFKFLSKNILGSVTTLLLVILLTQSRVFDFLINTPLGRALFIIAILGISYCHKIFGVAVILFVIIIFNHSDIAFMEGFTDTDTTTTTSTSASTEPSSTPVTAAAILEKKKEATDKVTELARLGLLAQRNSSTNNSSSSTSTETFAIREGFNTVDREGTLLRGKRSNEVPVFSSSRNQSDDVEPMDKSVFTNSFSSI